MSSYGVPICRLLLYPKPAVQDRLAPKWEVVPIRPNMDFRYGRARFLEQVKTETGAESYRFYAWGKPDQFADPHRENDETPIGKPASGAVIICYAVGRDFGRYLTRLDAILSDGFARLSATSGQGMSEEARSTLIYARSVLDFWAGQHAYPYCEVTRKNAKEVQKGISYTYSIKKLFKNIEDGQDLRRGSIERDIQAEIEEAKKLSEAEKVSAYTKMSEAQRVLEREAAAKKAKGTSKPKTKATSKFSKAPAGVKPLNFSKRSLDDGDIEEIPVSDGALSEDQTIGTDVLRQNPRPTSKRAKTE